MRDFRDLKVWEKAHQLRARARITSGFGDGSNQLSAFSNQSDLAYKPLATALSDRVTLRADG